MKQKIITSIWQVLRALVWYYLKRVKKLNIKDEKNNKLISFCIDSDKLSEKNKMILTKIEDLQYIELNALPVYGGIYFKKK